MNDNVQDQIEAIEAQRRAGSISAAEAYRQHQALLKPVASATPPLTPPPPLPPRVRAPVAASPAPAGATDAMTPQQIGLLVAAGLLVLIATIVIGLTLTGVIFSHSKKSQQAVVPSPIATAARSLPVLPTIPPATPSPVTPRPTATPSQGGAGGGSSSVADCNPPASADMLALVSADPPVGGPPPTGNLTVRVRYTLASADSARLTLVSSDDAATPSFGFSSNSVMVSRGSADVTFTRLSFGSQSSSNATYTVLLSPADGSPVTCATALAALPLSYTP